MLRSIKNGTLTLHAKVEPETVTALCIIDVHIVSSQGTTRFFDRSQPCYRKVYISP